MQAGLIIAQSLRLTRPLGEGGMGSVWLADHLALKTQVVVKFMSEDLARDPANRDRFTREAIAASQVKSPHVVQTFDHGTTVEGVPFIVMELLEGEDLSHRIRRGPLSPRETATVLGQVCRALTRAHAIGVVHRDIKPDNIFLCDVGAEEPFVKLLDFGIAKSSANPSTHGQTRTGAMMGTPYYMSPEQFTGARDIDLRTDLWSLGVVAFECLTARRPFDAETLGGLAVIVHSSALPVPTATRADLPPAVDAWFARACARSPADRFQSARELGDAFAVAAVGGVLSQSSPRNESRASESAADALATSDTLPLTAAPPAPAVPMFLTTGAGATVESTTTAGLPAPGRGSRVAIVLLAGALVVAGVVVAVMASSKGGASAATGGAPSAVSAAPPVDPSVNLAVEALPSAASATPAASSSTTAAHARPSPPPSAARPTAPTAKPHSSAGDPFGDHVF